MLASVILLTVVLLGVIVFLHRKTNGESTRIIRAWGGICIFVALCFGGYGIHRLADNADDINNNDIEAVKQDIDRLQGSIDEFNGTATEFHTDFDNNTNGIDGGLDDIRGEISSLKCSIARSALGTPEEREACDRMDEEAAQKEAEKKEKDNG